MAAERRHYPRFTLASRLNVLLKPPGSTPRSYRVVNFSRGGLLLLEAQAQPHVRDSQPAHSPDLKAGQIVQIIFSDAPAGPDTKHVLEAAVVRLSEVHVGIRFSDPDSKVLDRLHAIVMRHVGTEEARRQVGALLDAVRDDLAVDEPEQADEPGASPPQMRLGESKTQAPGWLSWTVIPALILLAVALVYLYRIDERLTAVEMAASSPAEPNPESSSIETLREELRVIESKAHQALSGVAALQNGSANDDRFLVLETHKEQLAQLNSEVDALKGQLQSLQDKAANTAAPPANAGSQESAASQTKPAASWVVYVMSALNEGALVGMEDKLRQLGVSGEREVATVRGETRHRLLVSGFQSDADAQAFARQIQEQLELRDRPWVARRAR